MQCLAIFNPDLDDIWPIRYGTIDMQILDNINAFIDFVDLHKIFSNTPGKKLALTLNGSKLTE